MPLPKNFNFLLVLRGLLVGTDPTIDFLGAIGYNKRNNTIKKTAMMEKSKHSFLFREPTDGVSWYKPVLNSASKQH